MVSTLRAHELLTHPVRAEILQRLQREPGLAFLALFEHLRAHPVAGRGLGFGSLLHHLRMLERHGRILPRKSARHRRYYLTQGAGHGAADALAILQTATGAALARALLSAPGSTQSAICGLVQRERVCTRQSVAYYLRRLQERGLVACERRGSAKHYVANERLARLAEYLPPASPRPSWAGAVPIAVTG